MDFEYTSDVIIDSKVIFHYMEPRTLSAAYRYYCDKEHEAAHSAIGDVEVTAEILMKQLEKYQEASDMAFINRIHSSSDDRFVDNERKFYWRNGEAYFSFSKHKDAPLSEVVKTDPGFLQWVMGADFSDETKEIVKKALGGEFPKKKIKIS
jgi:DNA polymerase III subunit epsilon